MKPSQVHLVDWLTSAGLLDSQQTASCYVQPGMLSGTCRLPCPIGCGVLPDYCSKLQVAWHASRNLPVALARRVHCSPYRGYVHCSSSLLPVA